MIVDCFVVSVWLSQKANSWTVWRRKAPRARLFCNATLISCWYRKLPRQFLSSLQFRNFHLIPPIPPSYKPTYQQQLHNHPPPPPPTTTATQPFQRSHCQPPILLASPYTTMTNNDECVLNYFTAFSELPKDISQLLLVRLLWLLPCTSLTYNVIFFWL